MNRTLKESVIGGRNGQHRRGLSLTGMSRDIDENLDLFSRSRRTLSVTSSDESDLSVKLGRLSVGSAKLAKSGMDDLLSSTDGGKHDYDWLLTPPETPLFPSSNGIESQQSSAAPRSSSLARAVSTTKASRLSVSQSESNHSSRPIRSSSVTRSSISSTQYSTYSNKSTSVLNTSSVSVSSYTRPSTPTARSSSTARPSTPSARPASSRSSTPSRARPSLTSSSIERTRPSQNSRPSTPTSRPQISANLSNPVTRSASRPSTPTRRNSAPLSSPAAAPSLSPAAAPSTPTSRPQISANLSNPVTRSASRPSTPTRRNSAPLSSPAAAPSLSPAAAPSASVGRVPSNGRTAVTSSRPSSPSTRIRPPPQPIILPDFSLETPPNLRTTLPDRPLSAGRSRPGVAVTVKGNVENPSASLPRRQPSPIASRGRLTEPGARGRLHANGQAIDTMESCKSSHVLELSTRKPSKTSLTSTDSSGFGRTISKKSLDMAIRHMDIRNGTSCIRPLSGTTLFPQSIRSANPKGQNVRTASAPASVNGNLPINGNGVVSENGNNYINRSPANGTKEENFRPSARLSEVDIYESSRYDAILLKEDLKNTNWLHSADDKSDQGLIFDNGFEPLPEPFDPL